MNHIPKKSKKLKVGLKQKLLNKEENMSAAALSEEEKELTERP